MWPSSIKMRMCMTGLVVLLVVFKLTLKMVILTLKYRDTRQHLAVKTTALAGMKNEKWIGL